MEEFAKKKPNTKTNKLKIINKKFEKENNSFCVERIFDAA